MKKFNLKKVAAGLLAIGLTAASLAGCGKADTTVTTPSPSYAIMSIL